METLTVLQAAQMLISDPEKWAKDHYAVNERGLPVPVADPEAVRWCALGAVGAVATEHDMEVSARLKEAANKLGFSGPVTLNDAADHATVMKMFDRAIERARLLADAH